MPKVDLQSQIVLTVVGLLVTAALVFVGISFLGMQNELKEITTNVTTLQTLQEITSDANAKAFKDAGDDLASVKTDLKEDIRDLKKDLKEDIEDLEDLWDR